MTILITEGHSRNHDPHLIYTSLIYIPFICVSGNTNTLQNRSSPLECPNILPWLSSRHPSRMRLESALSAFTNPRFHNDNYLRKPRCHLAAFPGLILIPFFVLIPNSAPIAQTIPAELSSPRTRMSLLYRSIARVQWILSPQKPFFIEYPSLNHYSSYGHL